MDKALGQDGKARKSGNQAVTTKCRKCCGPGDPGECDFTRLVPCKCNHTEDPPIYWIDTPTLKEIIAEGNRCPVFRSTHGCYHPVYGEKCEEPGPFRFIKSDLYSKGCCDCCGYPCFGGECFTRTVTATSDVTTSKRWCCDDTTARGFIDVRGRRTGYKSYPPFDFHIYSEGDITSGPGQVIVAELDYGGGLVITLRYTADVGALCGMAWMKSDWVAEGSRELFGPADPFGYGGFIGAFAGPGEIMEGSFSYSLCSPGFVKWAYTVRDEAGDFLRRAEGTASTSSGPGGCPDFECGGKSPKGCSDCGGELVRPL